MRKYIKPPKLFTVFGRDCWMVKAKTPLGEIRVSYTDTLYGPKLYEHYPDVLEKALSLEMSKTTYKQGVGYTPNHIEISKLIRRVYMREARKLLLRVAPTLKTLTTHGGKQK